MKEGSSFLLRRRSVLGDCLGAFRHGVLGQLSGEKQAHSSLYLSRRDGLLLVVETETGSLAGNPLEDVIHEGVHDRHAFGADACVRVHLFQDFVDVDGVRLLPLPLSLLAISSRAAGLLACLFLGFLSSDGGHSASKIGSVR